MRLRTSDLSNDLSARRATLRGLVSLAELNLTAEDSHLLREWARDTARPIEARNMKERFGLTFLAAATVIARDQAGEGTLYPHLVEVFGLGDAKVFVAPKQLHADVRDAIAAAVKVFGLRHALGRDADEQRWYLTVLLQCGWTRPGISERLAFWLAGHPLPRSMALLIDDAELSSVSFREVFANLLRFRRGEKNHVPASPWLGGDLHKLAVGKARADLHLGTSTGGRSTSCGVRLLAPAHQVPRFLLDPVLPLDLVRDDGCARLRIRAGACSTFAYRDPDGSYRSDGALELAISDDMAAEIEVEISADSGEVISREDVVLFGDEDVDLFVEIEENLYRRVPDAWAASAPVRRGILVRAADDLRIDGIFSRKRTHLAGSFWQAVCAAELHQLRVWIGDVAWDLPDDGRPRRQWPYSVMVAIESDNSWCCGQSISWLCSLGCLGARITRAWLGGRELVVELRRLREMQAADYRLVLDRASTLPKTWRLRLQVQVEHEGPPYLVYHEAVPPHCMRLLFRGPNGLVPISRGMVAWDALARPVVYFGRTGVEYSDHRPYLFEGELAVGPLGPVGINMSSRLVGLGGRLTVRTGRFNGEICGLGELEDHVENTGCVRGVARLPDDTDILRIDLDPNSELQPRDTVVETLSPEGQLSKIDSRLIEAGPGSIKALSDFEPVALAVAFRGCPVGCWAGSQTARTVKAACAQPRRFQAIALWLLTKRLPLERPDLRRVLVDLASQHPVSALRVILNPQFPKEEGLIGVWRQILSESYDSLRDALHVVPDMPDALGHMIDEAVAVDSSVPHPVAHLYWRLARTDPLGASLFLRAALTGRHHERTSDDPRACVEELSQWGDPRCTDTVSLARLLDVDEGVFDNLLGRVARDEIDPTARDRRDRNELLRYCYIPEFREALARAFVRPALKAARVSW